MFEKKPVLDATCGSRMIWFRKNNELAVFVDKREMDEERIWTSGNGLGVRTCTIKPDVLASFENLPFEDETFWNVVFDPPHLINVKENAWMYKKYGKLEKDTWKKVLKNGFEECWRVLKTHGTLVFKWAETEKTASEIINVIGHVPLYGARMGKQMGTHWMVFIKES